MQPRAWAQKRLQLILPVLCTGLLRHLPAMVAGKRGVEMK